MLYCYLYVVWIDIPWLYLSDDFITLPNSDLTSRMFSFVYHLRCPHCIVVLVILSLLRDIQRLRSSDHYSIFNFTEPTILSDRIEMIGLLETANFICLAFQTQWTAEHRLILDPVL